MSSYKEKEKLDEFLQTSGLTVNEIVRYLVERHDANLIEILTEESYAVIHLDGIEIESRLKEFVRTDLYPLYSDQRVNVFFPN